MKPSELAIIGSIRRRIEKTPQLLIGPGDDAALVDFMPLGQALVTVDMLMDGVHFQLDKTAPERIGRKALAVNLSDIAAMAGKPTALFVALALPKNQDTKLVDGLMRGIELLANEFEVAVAGGDTNIWNGPLVISITVMGEPSPKGVARRNGAKVGDLIFVTGALGGSIRGHHFDFQPRVAEAQWLMEHYPIHAMIDISDGLATDLRHICQESGCAAVLYQAKIPCSDDLSEFVNQEERIHHALSDGEDFELCFTLSQADGEALLRDRDLPIAMTVIGRCVSGDGIFWEGIDDSRIPIVESGYEHRFS